MMSKEQKKQLAAQYAEQERIMGVYEITNTETGRKFIGSSSNMEGAWNRERFQLDFGNHKNKELQADWNALGKQKFTFELLEKVKMEEKVRYDYKDVLQADAPEGEPAQRMRKYKKSATELEQLWIERCIAQGTACYNEIKE